LTDINDHPPVFVSPVFSANVLETAPRNTEVLTVKVFFFFLLPPLQGRQQKLPSAEAFKWAQCASPGQYTPCMKGIVKTP